jgi:cell wall-associated NlpC family hydrolase
MIARADVVTCARTWIDTPYQHQARLRGVGVDCAGLVIAVARELGIVEPDFDVQGYARQPDGVSLLAWCDQSMTPVSQGDMQPGDVVVVAFDLAPGHLGIVGDYLHGGLSIIHSLGITAGRVVETRLQFSRAMRFVRGYSMPGVA